MTTWISLLRGVNVGGKNLLPMKKLRLCLAELGYANVQTYIQSGNCVFGSNENDSALISRNIGKSILQGLGFEPVVMTISAGQLVKAIKQNPFAPQNVDSRKNDPKNIHFYFLSAEPTAMDAAGLEKLKRSSEEFELKKDVFYLLAPEGIARSKLAAGVEKKLGVNATSRNYRTVSKLAEMVSES